MDSKLNPEPRLHSGHMEVAVAMLLNYRVFTIVPNVFWGAGLWHEADLLAIGADGRITEVEIKISMDDLRNDFKKKHGHKCKWISRLVYAIPEKLLDKSLPLIPSQCGIITVKWNGYRFAARWQRVVRHDKTKELPSQQKIQDIMRLGCMRIWSLKTHNYNLKKRG